MTITKRAGLLLMWGLSGTCLYASGEMWDEKPAVSIFGFVDAFYVYDFSRPDTQQRQPFLYNHNRHNETNVNLALLQMRIEHPKYRSSIALQTGTYANDNYVNEEGTAKNIYEASVGFALNEANTLWLDAGIFPSFIGFESAISTENWTLTRSLLAENSPYFLSGTTLSYRPNKEWFFLAAVLNGWQRIQRVEGSSTPSFGTQISYTPNENVSWNWSTFVGTDEPDVTRKMRYFNNIYGKFQLSEKIGLIAGCDIGYEQKEKGSSAYNSWFAPVLISKYTVDKNWATALRVEKYHDKDGVIIATPTSNGFQTMGVSSNIDYTPASNVAVRLEARWLKSRDEIFPKDGAMSNNNIFVGASIAVKFSESLR